MTRLVLALSLLIAAALPNPAGNDIPQTAVGAPGAAGLIDTDFIPDAPFVGTVNGSYIDPEFSEGAAQIFDRPPQGRKFSTNGLEWTVDAGGPAVVSTKADTRGIMQQWLARLVGGRAFVRQLTSYPADCYGNMPSRFDDGRGARVAFTYEWPIWRAKAAWIFAERPSEFHVLDGFDYNRMSMWSSVSSDFLFVYRPSGAARGQIAPATGIDGQSCFALLARESADRNTPGGIWVLGLGRGPDDTASRAPGRAARRGEPGADGGGVPGAERRARFVRRIDDGALLGGTAVRLEPEPFLGTLEAYVYYNYWDPASGRTGLRRAATGLLTGRRTVR